jgi:hypothetical protein
MNSHSILDSPRDETSYLRLPRIEVDRPRRSLTSRPPSCRRKVPTLGSKPPILIFSLGTLHRKRATLATTVVEVISTRSTVASNVPRHRATSTDLSAHPHRHPSISTERHREDRSHREEAPDLLPKDRCPSLDPPSNRSKGGTIAGKIPPITRSAGRITRNLGRDRRSGPSVIVTVGPFRRCRPRIEPIPRTVAPRLH